MRERDSDAFDAFYRATAPRVIHLVYATTGDLTLAQDSTQEAFARAWRDWARVSTAEDPAAWVRTVARRIAISEWRRGQAKKRAYTRHGPQQSQTPPDENRMIVVAALRRLTPVLRETVALHYLADRSIEQIAAELAVPEGTVKARLHRGRVQLADLLRDTPAPAHRDPAQIDTAHRAPAQRKENRHG